MAASEGHSSAPQKSLAEHVTIQAQFLDTKLNPTLNSAQSGEGHVFFVDAAHFVYGTFLCCLWSFVRQYVRAASGRQRFNVLGAWNGVTRELVSVTNTTVVNTQTMCQLLSKIAELKLIGPITLVLDNARCQRNDEVMGVATRLNITLMFLPSCSPNLAPYWTLSSNDSGSLSNAGPSTADIILRLLISKPPSNRRSIRFQTPTRKIWPAS